MTEIDEAANLVLTQHENLFPHQKDALLADMRTYYSEKLWYQLTTSLLSYIKDPAVLSQGQQLIPFYDNFVKKFGNKINEFSYVRFIIQASEFRGSDEEKISFLDDFLNDQLKDDQTKWIVRLKLALYKLNLGQYEAVQSETKEIAENLNRCSTVEPLVFSLLYKTKLEYFKIKNIQDEYYKNALQYLAYTQEDEIQENDKLELSVSMALAILISPKIYNFSELLEQTVIKSLLTSKFKWVYTILQTYNLGDVKLFLQDLDSFRVEIDSQYLLKQNRKTLDEKIRIMAFLELIFSLPKNQRDISFQQLAEVTHVNLDQVELLVMRTMSLGLVKGTINQMQQLVKIQWVIPRVLDVKRIQIVKEKFENWHESLKTVLMIVESKVPQNN